MRPRRLTLEDLAKEWLAGPAESLRRSTVRNTVEVIDSMIVKQIGTAQVGSLTRQEVDRWMADLAVDGRPPDRRRRALKALRMLLDLAVAWQYAATNPAKSVKLPAAPMREVVRPLSPAKVESMRRYMLDRDRPQDAVLLTLMAYAGLRPGEVTVARWQDLGQRTITVAASKTSRTRSVVLMDPVLSELREHRLQSGRPTSGLIYPRPVTGAWSESAYRNWRRNLFDPAAASAGEPTATPKVLRASFASLMHAAHKPPVWVAQQMGHSLRVHLDHYVHLIEDVDPDARVDPAAMICTARAIEGPRNGHVGSTG